jgi:hypothetical protein
LDTRFLLFEDISDLPTHISLGDVALLFLAPNIEIICRAG